MNKDRQKFMNYIHFLDRKYGVGNISQANEEEIKKLRKLEPKREPKLAKYYIKKGYTSIEQLKNEELEAAFRRHKVDYERLKKEAKDQRYAFTNLNTDYGIQSVGRKMNGQTRWSLKDLNVLCDIFNLKPKEIVAEGEPADINVLVPVSWVRLGLLKYFLGDMTIEQFGREIGGSKKYKLEGKSRFSLAQLKKAGSLAGKDLKTVMTKKGYQKLEEKLHEFRPIEIE